jgi:hypothetical protein
MRIVISSRITLHSKQIIRLSAKHSSGEQYGNSTNDRFAPEAALGGLEIQLPPYPQNRTQLGNRGMSEMFQYRPKGLARSTYWREKIDSGGNAHSGKSCAPKRLHFLRSGGTLMSAENTWTGAVVDAHAHF